MMWSRLELRQVAKKTSSTELTFSSWSCRNTNAQYQSHGAPWGPASWSKNVGTSFTDLIYKLYSSDKVESKSISDSSQIPLLLITFKEIGDSR